jgi:PAS domain S-box-containing protein
VRASRHAVERQQLRLELKASEAYLCAIIENNADGIVVVNRAGIVQFVNPSAEALFGRPVDELVGKPFDFLITPIETSELNLVCHDGQTATVEMHVVETAWSGEAAYLASLRDITARKRAEEALRHEKGFSERLIHSSVDGIFAFDRECRYTVWNPGMERISGVGKEDALGNLAFEVFPFLKEIGEDKFFFEALAGRTVVAENRPYIIPETGRQGFFEGHYSPLRRESGEIIGGLAIIRDITERTQVEKTQQDNLQQLEIAYEQATIYAQELIQEILERKLADKALRDAYDELEMRVLERTMDLSRANEALQNEIKEREQMEDLLRVQRDLGLAISIGPGLDETLRLCVDAAIRVSGMDCGGIYLVDEDSGDLELVFHQGLSADFIKSVSRYPSDSANTHLVMAGKPVYTQYRDLAVSLDNPESCEGLRATAIIPVRHQDRVVACLNIVSHTTDEVSLKSGALLRTREPWRRCGRAKNATRLLRVGLTMGCGIGICKPTRFISLLAGNRCSATRKMKLAIVQTNGSAGSILRILSRSKQPLPLIVKDVSLTWNTNIACCIGTESTAGCLAGDWLCEMRRARFTAWPGRRRTLPNASRRKQN